MGLSATKSENLWRFTNWSLYDAAREHHVKTWGVEMPAHVRIAVVCGDGMAIRSRVTIFALRDAGLIDLDVTYQTSTKPCRGAYGRRIDGVKTREYASYAARPTDAGRALLAERSAATAE